MSNLLEDDEVTARGGDGVIYGDSVISTPTLWNGNDWDFATTMEASIFGPWSTFNTSGNFSVSKAPPGNTASSSWLTLLGFAAGDTLVMGDDNMSPAKTAFSASLSATDSVNSISDSCVYKMTAHIMAENPISKGEAASTKLYKVHETFPDYTGSHDPMSLLRIDAPTTKKLSVAFSSTVTSTKGWEASGDGSIGFPIKMIDLHFGGSFKKSGSVTMTHQYSITGDWVVPENTYLEFWDLPKGTVTKYMFERYGNNGYIQDGAEFELSKYSEAFTWNTGPMSSPSVWP
ncbi:MAG: hypothetical protein WCI55_14910 [Armatimonadota bacterium]